MKKNTILKFALAAFTIAAALQACAQTDRLPRREVLLKTSKGDIRIALYNAPSQHRDNFIKLVNEGY